MIPLDDQLWPGSQLNPPATWREVREASAHLLPVVPRGRNSGAWDADAVDRRVANLRARREAMASARMIGCGTILLFFVGVGILAALVLL